MSDTNDTRRPLEGLRRANQTMGDVAYAAFHLYETVYFAGADNAIEAHTPMLWEVVSELVESVDAVNPTQSESFGLLLALRAILRHPEVLQLATERIADHLAALVDVDIVLSDMNTLAICMPAVAERLIEVNPELGEQAGEVSHEN